MSRNLGMTSCHECPSPRVTLVEAPRPMLAEECGVYSEYVGMIVANAECPECGAKYVAWIRGSFLHHWNEEREYSDLSYRSSFNDEPGVADLPVYEVERTILFNRVRRIQRCPNGIDLDRADHRNCYGCAWDAKVRAAAEKGWWGTWWTREKDGVLVRHRPIFNEGPFPTRSEAEVARQKTHDGRAAYYDRCAGRRAARRADVSLPRIEEILVEQWTAENVPAGLYNLVR